MAETTAHSAEWTRAETAEFLRGLADELDSSSGRVRVPIGNKDVQLSPPDSIDAEAAVTERSRRIRKDTEQLALTFKWNPTKDTAESDAEAATERDADDGQRSGTEPTIEGESSTERDSETGR